MEVGFEFHLRVPPPPKPFPDGAAFGAWLEKNSARETELLVKIYKTHALAKGMGYRAALEEALCWGWIDGVRRFHDEDSFSIRFSPRKAKSIWSAVNIDLVAKLRAAGRMKAPGEAAFAKREESRSRVYSFENKPKKLDPPMEKKFRANKEAWKYFQAKAPWYQRTSLYWVMSAKKEETRERRLQTLIDCSAGESDIPHLTRDPKPKSPRKKK